MHTKTDLFCLEVGGPAEFDGKDDAGQHGGGTHDVFGNMPGYGRCDGTADGTSDAHHDGERPIHGSTNDEHDRCGNVRTEANHRFQRVDLMERADLTQI